MSDGDLLTDAVQALNDAAFPTTELCRPVVDALGFDHAGLVTIGPPLGTAIVSASDTMAAQLVKLELELGDGPGWQCTVRRAPVIEPDLNQSRDNAWPLTRQKYLEVGLGAVFSLPLTTAGVEIGALTLYSRSPAQLVDQQWEDAQTLARILARQVLYRAPLPDEIAQADESWRQYSHREIDQACGMVIAQMGTTASDALTVLRDHASRTGRTLRDVSADVIARTIDFTPSR